jgi:3-hydroxybutyryl-CoA dehydrogenase
MARANSTGDPAALALIGLLGAGRMGRGIALAFAFAGHEAVLIDIKPRTPQEYERLRTDALAEIEAGLTTMVEIGALPPHEKVTVSARIRIARLDEAPQVLGRVDILFEGVPETLEAKKEAFAYAGRFLRPDAIVASTTSTILSSDLAGFIVSPERFLNAHWLNPAFLVPIVELSAHAGTDEAVVARLDEVLRGLGKRPIRCAATPGYVVPRLQSLIMNEAARMVEEGVATAEQIDEAVRFGFGFRYTTIGAVEFIDFGGLDILYHANRYLTQALGERYRLAPIVERYMAEGRLGLRAGQGFYNYEEVSPAARRTAVLQRQYRLLQYLDAAPAFNAAQVCG